MILKALSLLALTAPVCALEPSNSNALGSNAHSNGGDLLAIRVGRAETISHGTLHHAVILVEGGKIVTIGEDLPIDRGIPILDRPDWVAMPGLVSAHTRIGLARSSSRGFDPVGMPAREIYPRQEIWQDLLELGVTTLGIVPEGNSGVPGQAIAIRPRGETVEEMIVEKGVYLKVNMSSSASAKKIIRDAFEKVDKHKEKVEKEREKWEKANSKKKKKKSRSKKDDDKDKEDEKEDRTKSKKEESKEFVPPAPAPAVQTFMDLREGSLNAVISIRKAGDYLHLLDLMKDEESVPYFLRVPLRTDIDLFEVAEKLGEKETLLILNSQITLQAHSRRERNIPAELVRAGASIALTPERDFFRSYEEWMNDVGFLVSRGLDRDKALAAITLEGARALGLDERLGSLDVDKDANIIFWDGDPLEPASTIEAVMLEGDFVAGEVD